MNLIRMLCLRKFGAICSVDWKIHSSWCFERKWQIEKSEIFQRVISTPNQKAIFDQQFVSQFTKINVTVELLFKNISGSILKSLKENFLYSLSCLLLSRPFEKRENLQECELCCQSLFVAPIVHWSIFYFRDLPFFTTTHSMQYTLMMNDEY